MSILTSTRDHLSFKTILRGGLSSEFPVHKILFSQTISFLITILNNFYGNMIKNAYDTIPGWGIVYLHSIVIMRCIIYIYK